MSGAVYDRWYCSPYPQSIAFQLQEAIPHSHAEQIRQVAQNEGAVLTRIEGLIFLVTLAALFASALAVSAAMATAIFERRAEVGLMKALGAGKLAVASVFFAEADDAGFDWGVCGIRGGRDAGASDRTIDFQFADHDCSGAFAGDSSDCGDRHICRKRRRHSQSGAGLIRYSPCEVNCERGSIPILRRRCRRPRTGSAYIDVLRMLVRAAVLRRGRAASALFAMVVAAAVATAMLNLYVDVQAKLRREFRNYGANIILVGKDGASLPA